MNVLSESKKILEEFRVSGHFEHDFLRINSCYLVAKKEIVGVKNHFVVMKNGERLLISRPRMAEVLATLKKEGKGEQE